jgi:hypothetical protein
MVVLVWVGKDGVIELSLVTSSEGAQQGDKLDEVQPPELSPISDSLLLLLLTLP